MTSSSSAAPTRKLLAMALIAAPLLMLASTAVQAAAGSLGENEAGGVIQVFAAPAYFLAIAGLAALVATAYPRAAAALLLTGAVGCAGVATYGLNSAYVDVGSLDLNEGEAMSGALALQLPGIFFPLTLAGLGVALLRARQEPRWAAATIAIGAVLFPLSRIPGVVELAIVSDLILAAGLVQVGIVALRSERGGATSRLAAETGA